MSWGTTNPLQITSQPQSASVISGAPVSFSVVAQGGTTPYTYQWRKNGGNIGGASASTYSFTSAASSDAGVYDEVLKDSAAHAAISQQATLTVNQVPTITVQPAPQTVVAGKSATFSVTATSSFLGYQWYRGNTAIAGATGISYTLQTVASTDNSAVFSVKITNPAGTVTSAGGTLTVNLPSTITTQPASVTVGVGRKFSFKVVATGTATLNYQWYKRGVAITGATLATYSGSTATVADSGATYYVTVRNAFGSVNSATATLTVR